MYSKLLKASYDDKIQNKLIKAIKKEFKDWFKKNNNHVYIKDINITERIAQTKKLFVIVPIGLLTITFSDCTTYNYPDYIRETTEYDCFYKYYIFNTIMYFIDKCVEFDSDNKIIIDNSLMNLNIIF